jgi:pimeloyl-ACP methyl ester carboxylesterase
VPNVEVPGAQLHYERAGSGEPLLLVQGMSATHLAWGRPFLSLLERDFDCIVFDNRGIGLSAPFEGRFTTADMATDAAGLLDALDVERAHVFGISMGGMIAQELALAQPERLASLTLGATYCGGEGSTLMGTEETQLLGEAMQSGNRDKVFRAMWEINLSPTFRADDSGFAAFVEMASALPARRDLVFRQMRACVQHDTQARLGQIATPTLVVHGTEDRVLGVGNGRQIASLLPAARLELLDGIGHMFWWEQPERSAELIREYALAPA